MAREILVATATHLVSMDGREVFIVAGKTTVREGHPLLEGREESFAPLVPTFELDAAPQAPTPPKPAAEKKAAEKPAATD